MNALDNFHFIRPYWLLLLPLALLLWWWMSRAQDPLRGWRAVIDRDLLQALTVGQSHGGQRQGLLLLVAWVLAIVAIAGPTWQPEPSPFGDDPVPVMIVLRAGDSMNLSDLMPNRMERARLKVADFADLRKGQPLGLVAYAETAHLVLPPTRDTSVVASMASEISPEIMPKQGDQLGAALKRADATLDQSGGSIVVVTDTATSNPGVAEFAANSRTPVYILAVARPDTPEMNAINKTAAQLGASVTAMTPDDADVTALIRKTARNPISIQGDGQETRWAESGWWLVPLLAILALYAFRRSTTLSSDNATLSSDNATLSSDNEVPAK